MSNSLDCLRVVSPKKNMWKKCSLLVPVRIVCISISQVCLDAVVHSMFRQMPWAVMMKLCVELNDDRILYFCEMFLKDATVWKNQRSGWSFMSKTPKKYEPHFMLGEKLKKRAGSAQNHTASTFAGNRSLNRLVCSSCALGFLRMRVTLKRYAV